MAIGNLQYGAPLTPSSYAANVLVLGRDGVLLGFWAQATGAVTIYDSLTVAGIGTAILPSSACAVGWNPFPVALTKGLVVNAATATGAVFVVA
jgi:hypothetical protein